MKNIKICLLFVVAGMFFSCNDAIDIVQPGETDPSQVIKTVNDLQKNLLVVYSSVGYENEISFNSIFTDECAIGLANGGQGISDGEYSYVLNSNSSGPAGIWFSYYSTITKANRVILGAQGIETEAGSADEAKKNSIVAQARALRAFSYFQLMAYFSIDLTNDSGLGVMLYDYVPTNDTPAIQRSSNKEVFDFIDADLTYATANVVDFVDPATTPDPKKTFYYVSQNFITGLKARMALYRGKYTDAMGYAQTLIDKVPLSDKVTYPTIYSSVEATGECFFRLRRTARSTSDTDFKVGSIWNSVSTKADGSPFYEVGRSLFNLFPKNGPASSFDVRRNVMTSGASRIAGNYQSTQDYRVEDVLIVGKYPGTANDIFLLNDIKVFRVSEMYLIKAEAQVVANDLVGAAATLQEIRKARYINTSSLPAQRVYANQTEAYADVLYESRKELAFEGHRYLDMKRLAIKADVTFDRDPLDCAINGSCDFSNDDHRLKSLPIPISELTANPLIRAQQNPGY